MGDTNGRLSRKVCQRRGCYAPNRRWGSPDGDSTDLPGAVDQKSSDSMNGSSVVVKKYQSPPSMIGVVSTSETPSSSVVTNTGVSGNRVKR